MCCVKTAVVDTGGGLRGIYAAGVFDKFMEMGITFDFAVGVSAGSANVASFLGSQPGRNYVFYTVYARRPRYMSLWNFFRSRNYIDLDYVYGTLSNSDGEHPLDYKQLQENPTEFIVVATDAETGEPAYFTKDDLTQDHYDIFKASSAMPFACLPYDVNGREYFDGALSDPLPVHLALERGCTKIVLLITSPRDVLRTNSVDAFFAKGIQSKYPIAAQKLVDRANVINESLKQLRQYEEEGKLLIIAPDDACGVKVLEKRRERLDRLYEKGRTDADAVKKFLETP